MKEKGEGVGTVDCAIAEDPCGHVADPEVWVLDEFVDRVERQRVFGFLGNILSLGRHRPDDLVLANRLEGVVEAADDGGRHDANAEQHDALIAPKRRCHGCSLGTCYAPVVAAVTESLLGDRRW